MITQAIKRLRPNAEFSITGDMIKWDKIEGEPPTRLEIEAEVAFLESEEYKKEQLKSQTLDEVEKIALKELLAERIKADPYLSAKLNVESKIDSGEINENARKAIRDEIKRKAK